MLMEVVGFPHNTILIEIYLAPILSSAWRINENMRPSWDIAAANLCKPLPTTRSNCLWFCGVDSSRRVLMHLQSIQQENFRHGTLPYISISVVESSVKFIRINLRQVRTLKCTFLKKQFNNFTPANKPGGAFHSFLNSASSRMCF